MLHLRWKWAWCLIPIATAAALVFAQSGHTPKTAWAAEPSLAEARVKAAKRGYDALFEPAKNGSGVWPSPEVVYLWSRRWLEAELDVADKPTSQRTAYREHRDRMNEIVERHRHLPSSAPASVSYQTSAEYFLAE